MVKTLSINGSLVTICSLTRCPKGGASQTANIQAYNLTFNAQKCVLKYLDLSFYNGVTCHKKSIKTWALFSIEYDESHNFLK